MKRIEQRLRDELPELASWLIDRRAEPNSGMQPGSDSVPELNLGTDSVPLDRRRWLLGVAAGLVAVGLVGASVLLSEDDPSVVTVPSDPAVQTPATPTTSTPPPTTTHAADRTEGDVDGTTPEDVDVIATEDNAPTEEVVDPPADDQEGFAQYWLMPWGQGFLRVGLQTGEQSQNRSHLFAQTSDDGLDWSELIELNVPLEHFAILDGEKFDPGENYYSYPEGVYYLGDFFPIVRSDGERLVIVTQLPGSHLANKGAGAALNKRAAASSAHVEQRAFVSVTSDLATWDNFEYPLLRPEDLHESLSVAISAEEVIVTSEKLLIQISTLTYMDIGKLLPSFIRKSSEDISWSEEYRDDEGELAMVSGGLMIKWVTEDTNSGTVESNERYFSWGELGTTSGLFGDYALIGNKPYHYGYRYSTSVIHAAWGNEPKHTYLPSGLGIRPSIVATDSGYIALSDTSFPAYRVGVGGVGRVLTSPDGSAWSFSDSWTSDVLVQRDYVVDEIPRQEAVAFGLSSVENGVIIRVASGAGSTNFSVWPVNIYLGDTDGTSWIDIVESFYPIDKPRTHLHDNRDQIRTQGTGIIYRIAEPLIQNTEPVASDLSYLYTVTSVDGFNWFKIVEESDELDEWQSLRPHGWSAAFNGNVVVLLDSEGKSYRYELV